MHLTIQYVDPCCLSRPSRLVQPRLCDSDLEPTYQMSVRLRPCQLVKDRRGYVTFPSIFK